MLKFLWESVQCAVFIMLLPFLSLAILADKMENKENNEDTP